MKRLNDLFSEKDRQAVSDAIREAESRTSGEIVAVVAAASGAYGHAAGLFAVLAAVAALVVGALVLRRLPGPGSAWTGPGPGQILAVNALSVFFGYQLGLVLTEFLPILKMPFAPRAEVERELRRSASAAYQRFKVGRTVHSTGVLIYVSLQERRALVLGDGAVNEKLEDKDWQGVCRLVTQGMAASRPTDGLCAAVHAAGELLAKHFPLKIGDTNELSNTLNLLDELP